MKRHLKAGKLHLFHGSIEQAIQKNAAENDDDVADCSGHGSNVAAIAGAVAPGADLRLATDIPDYVRQAVAEVPRAGFTLLTPDPAQWATPWDDWISTRYEQKALREGRRPHYLTFRRTDAPAPAPLPAD